MELIQTNSQSIIDRLYKTSFMLLFPQIISLIIVGSRSSRDTMWLVFVVFIAVNILIPIWLVFFNSGASKINAFSIDVDDQKIRVSTYATAKTIRMASYRGYKITWLYPKQIKLFDANGQHVAFSYYALNKKQRKTLFNVLGPAIS